MVNITYDASGSIVSTAENGTVAVYSPGDLSWILTSTALVLIMSPGLGFYYSGMLRHKSALHMIFLSLAIYAVISIQWFFWGFSLAFSASAGPYIGNLDNFGLMGVKDEVSIGSAKLPGLAFAVYQMVFATCTAVVMCGAFAERGRFLPILVFAFCWATIVYDPIACWTWNPAGWSYKLGTLDFAGGGPVHMSSGAGALAISIYLGKRKGWGTEKLSYAPHNVSHTVLGTALLWFGWFGFNGASALAANLRAVQAIIATNTAASAGGLAWMAMDYFRGGKWSPVGFCAGAIAGLVGITPAAGYVGTPSSLAIGVVTGVACNLATGLKHTRFWSFDDTLDIFACHGIGGFVGALMTGLFADSRVAGFDGLTVIPGGWINKEYITLAYQLADATAILSYSFVLTMVLLFLIDHVPGLKFRAPETSEIVGMDICELGEAVYEYQPVAAQEERIGPGSSYSSEQQEKPAAPVA